MPDHELTAEELNLLGDRSFFDLRARIYEKMQGLLEELKKELEQASPPALPPFTDAKWVRSGKISKGENYKGLPFRVVDYPANFEQNHLFIFRTLLLWGCHFSFHLILTGKQMEQHREALVKGYPTLRKLGFRLSRQDSPWDWDLNANSHYEIEELSPTGFANAIAEVPFIKLTREWPIEQYLEVPKVGRESWEALFGLLGF